MRLVLRVAVGVGLDPDDRAAGNLRLGDGGDRELRESSPERVAPPGAVDALLRLEPFARR